MISFHFVVCSFAYFFTSTFCYFFFFLRWLRLHKTLIKKTQRRRNNLQRSRMKNRYCTTCKCQTRYENKGSEKEVNLPHFSRALPYQKARKKSPNKRYKGKNEMSWCKERKKNNEYWMYNAKKNSIARKQVKRARQRKEEIKKLHI